MNLTGPESVDGWMNFLEDEDEVWFEAFELGEDGTLDVDHYDEFDDIQDLVNFVAGTGQYEDRNSFVPTEEDKEMRKREMHNDSWKVPSKMQEVFDYLEQGEPYQDIDIDPSARTGWSVSERSTNMDEHDTKYTAHFIAYDPEEDGGEGASVYFEVSWYDKEPSDMDLRELFEEKEEE